MAAAPSHPAGMYASDDAVIDSMEWGNERDDKIYQLLSSHPWVKSSNGTTEFETDAGQWRVAYANLSINPRNMSKFVENKARKKGEERPNEYRQPGDDMAYACAYDAECEALSYLLRKYQTRGFTHFRITGPSGKVTTLVIRGLNKFTGLTAADEDEVSDAPDKKDLFFADGISYTEADTIGVSVKSNGENGKGTLRKIEDTWWIFAGSKNTCLACPYELNPRTLFPDDNPAVPSPRIMHAFYDIIRNAAREGSIDDIGEELDSNDYVVLFEFNDANHEHIIPIDSNFTEAFALRGVGDIAVAPRVAFDFFDRYSIRHVAYYEQPIDTLQDVIAETRARTDTEGVVLYFMLEDRVIGALKVKSDFYTIARATRQKFWRIPDTINRGKGGKGKKKVIDYNLGDSLVQSVKESLTTRLQNMSQIPECEVMWPTWNKIARGFVDWWVAQYRAQPTNAAKKACIETAKTKFASLYRDYLESLEANNTADEPAAPAAE